MSSKDTSSASVELLVLIFCLVDTDWITPLPIVMVAPVWLLKSLWTANAASKCHLKLLILSASKYITSSAVFFRNLIIFFSLAQSSTVGAFTRVV
eukprot:CAMPEP_0113451570 /NCGR_PEP_ID=MMETSP0014_2-20120614/6405_1 /TAXON_ID=2857 /ORGANISM="Nitzschia sp." /LENGTH=94 /DNA_ID=CAMNT_0000342927 /DNA_START=290 /DNA_END=570 /DNA_ORIENTATION=- /assembly_acc=CAM_ASM_000159